MTKLNFEYFLKKRNLKNNTMNESDLQRVYNNKTNPKDSKIHSDKGFDNGSRSGTHWTCFIIKDRKSYYLDTFGGQPDEFLLNQVPKPILYHNYKIQDIDSHLYGS